jgi:hypothetical protein
MGSASAFSTMPWGSSIGCSIGYRQQKVQALHHCADHSFGLVHSDPAKVVPMKRVRD